MNKIHPRLSRVYSFLSAFAIVLSILLLAAFLPNRALAQEAQPERVNVRAAAVAAPQTLVINEPFNGATAPNGWTVNDTTNGGAWMFADPKGRTNRTGGQGNFAIIDSDHAGAGKQQNTELRAPAQDFTGAAKVLLKFKTSLRTYDGGNPEKADVDVSTDGGTTWTNVWRKTTDFAGNVTLDLTAQAAGKNNVVIRFRYYDAAWEWYWQLDDVQIDAERAAAAPTNLTAAAQGVNAINLTWQDNSANETGFLLERGTDGTTFAQIAQVAANQTTFANGNLACNTTYHYRVRGSNAAGNTAYTNVANAKTGACPTTSALNANFDDGTLPPGWAVKNAPDPTVGWIPRSSAMHVFYASATQVAVDSRLETPLINLTGQSGVQLIFSQSGGFSRQAGAAFTADVSNNGGATWTTVWTASDFSFLPKVITRDISALAGNRPNVKVRFRFVHPNFSGRNLLSIDNVKIMPPPPPPAPLTLTARTARNNDVLLTWTGKGNKDAAEIERSPNGNDSWAKIGETAVNGTTHYSDGTIQSNTTYHYRVRTRNGSGPSAYSNTASVTVGERKVRSFNISVSLHNNPTVAQRKTYEDLMRAFTDAMYEGSNGAHKLNRVTFYTNGAFADKANIVWRSGQGNAMAFSFLGGPGARILLYDVASTQNLLSTDPFKLVSNGSLLLHEWGHYAYGLQHNHITLTSMFLQNSPGSEFTTARDHQTNSVQHQAYTASHWDVMARQPTQDPRHGRIVSFPRPYYPELTTVKPPANQRFTAELPAGQAAARSDINFVWAAPSATRAQASSATTNAEMLQTAQATVVRQIVVETSAAAVSANQLVALKVALNELVDASLDGDTIGIISYDGSANVVQPMTVITGQATIDAVVNAIDAMTLGDNDAAPGVALQSAFDGITASAIPTDAVRAIYLIGSGSHNSGVHPVALLPDLQEAGIPVYTIGSGADEAGAALLKTLAQESEGAYRAADAGVEELIDATIEIEYASLPFSGVDLLSGGRLVQQGDVIEVPFVVDSKLSEIDIEVAYLGEEDALLASVVGPSEGNEINEIVFRDDGLCTDYFSGTQGDPNAPHQDVALETVCSTTINNPTVGDWMLQFQLADNVEVDYYVGGFPTDAQDTLPAYVTVINAEPVSNEVTYPKPLVVNAYMGSEQLVAGLAVSGTLTGPIGTFQAFALRDDGVNPDETANDGIYATLLEATVDGPYLLSAFFDNSAETGVFTSESHVDADDETQTPLGENVQRLAETVVYVTGAPAPMSMADDAPIIDDEEPMPIVALRADNTPAAGRIDEADDSALYEVTVPADFTGDFIVRVDSLALGMDPLIIARSVNNDGEDDEMFEREAFREIEPSSDDYLSITLDVDPSDVVQIEVMHFDPDATQGTYQISAGPRIVSDGPRFKAQKAPPTEEKQNAYLPLIFGQ